jgi:pyruvate/2-oxoglutarate dehydrogenase complex dihydrolipoamide dehydrogenase (E3) component
VPYFTNEDLMDTVQIPPRLLVVGGGYIACELGQAYARFGSDVTIVQSRSHLLPDEEPDVSTVLAGAFAREGIEVLLDQRAVSVERADGSLRLMVQSRDGKERELEGTHLLLAAGRRPNTDALDLGVAGVETDEKGFVRVNEHLETSAPGVYAAGDVLGIQPFTRVCQEEARVAYANAFEGARATLDRRSLGHAVFTDPEIASVGLTEAAARRAGREVAVGYVTFDQVTKADLIGETDGFIKYVVEPETRRLLGAHVIGPQAADLVYDASMLMRHQLPLDALGATVGIFPTLQEAMEGSARALVARLHARSGAAGRVTATSSHIACPECASEFESTDEHAPSATA